jgi:hypothetical protein
VPLSPPFGRRMRPSDRDRFAAFVVELGGRPSLTNFIGASIWHPAANNHQLDLRLCKPTKSRYYVVGARVGVGRVGPNK